MGCLHLFDAYSILKQRLPGRCHYATVLENVQDAPPVFRP